MIVAPLKVAILSEAGHELFPACCPEPVELLHFHDPEQFFLAKADMYVDCEFEPDTDRLQKLNALFPAVVLINAVSHTVAELGHPFVRFNGWSGFAGNQVLEIATGDEEIPAVLEQFALACGKTCIRVPDTVGMVRPRVISMIINEAWLALGEEVSTQQEIDTAMKLGTNYPFGPFEWGAKIGLKNVHQLLGRLALIDSKYQPAAALAQAVQTL